MLISGTTTIDVTQWKFQNYLDNLKITFRPQLVVTHMTYIGLIAPLHKETRSPCWVFPLTFCSFPLLYLQPGFGTELRTQ